jgi:hypothetical protein
MMFACDKAATEDHASVSGVGVNLLCDERTAYNTRAVGRIALAQLGFSPAG